MTCPDRIMALGDEHGRGIIRALPTADQRQIVEWILKFPPDRATQVWAGQVLLELSRSAA